jgi:pimeloyl-ACP methyl ester carboxylesterase
LLAGAAAALLSCSIAAQDLSGLPRAGDLGFRPAGTPEGRIAVAAIVPDTPITRAGLQKGDVIERINGQAVGNTREWFAARRTATGGKQTGVVVSRAGQAHTLRFVAAPIPLEKHEGLETSYTSAAARDFREDFKVRVIVTKPASTTARLPAVIFIPWLSCGTTDYPRGATDGWGKMLLQVARESGALMARIEKSGSGDSSGTICGDADLDADMAGFRAGIAMVAARDDVDPGRIVLFGGSIGAALAPVLAREFAGKLDFAGIVAAGGFAKTWLEHMLEVERRRLVLSGAAPDKIAAAMRGYADLYSGYLNGGATPGELIAKRPDLKALWTDEPAHQYGRPARYFQQVQKLDVWGAWLASTAPALLVHGEYDWIMSADDPVMVVKALNAKKPGQATLLLAPKMDHHFDRYPSQAAAFTEEGGSYDKDTVDKMVAWIRERVAR